MSDLLNLERQGLHIAFVIPLCPTKRRRKMVRMNRRRQLQVNHPHLPVVHLRQHNLHPSPQLLPPQPGKAHLELLIEVGSLVLVQLVLVQLGLVQQVLVHLHHPSTSFFSFTSVYSIRRRRLESVELE